MTLMLANISFYNLPCYMAGLIPQLIDNLLSSDIVDVVDKGPTQKARQQLHSLFLPSGENAFL